MNFLEWFLFVFFILPMVFGVFIFFVLLIYIVCNVKITITREDK
jgi:hypothetical protein